MSAPVAAGILLAACALPVFGADTAGWPPPPEILGRMRELQGVISDRNATREGRENARAELERLLKSPAGRARPAAAEAKRPARAAIEPYPRVVKPIERAQPAPPVAKLEVLPDPPAPRRPAVNPSSGSVIPPASGPSVDPRTGNILHDVPGGYIDPRTGQFVPRP